MDNVMQPLKMNAHAYFLNGYIFHNACEEMQELKIKRRNRTNAQFTSRLERTAL